MNNVALGVVEVEGFNPDPSYEANTNGGIVGEGTDITDKFNTVFRDESLEGNLLTNRFVYKLVDRLNNYDIGDKYKKKYGNSAPNIDDDFRESLTRLSVTLSPDVLKEGVNGNYSKFLIKYANFLDGNETYLENSLNGSEVELGSNHSLSKTIKMVDLLKVEIDEMVKGVVKLISDDLYFIGEDINDNKFKFINSKDLTPYLVDIDLRVLNPAKWSYYGPLLKQIKLLENEKFDPIRDDFYNVLNKINDYYEEKRYVKVNVS